MNLKKSSLNEVLESRARKSAGLPQTFEDAEGVQFSDVTGFHIYGDLRLRLRLAAAEEARNADKYLDILEQYAQIAEGCCAPSGATLLEVQGERLHFLLPAAVTDAASIKQLLAFSIALTNTIYDQVKPKAGGDWDGFALAADHGRAIVIATGRAGDDSVVSLGDAANRPAKRLARTPAVASGHLALRTPVIAKSPLLVAGGAYRESDVWVDINVKNPPDYLQPVVNYALQNQITESAAAGARAAKQQRGVIRLASATDLADHATIDEPVEVQAICIRADLDNFTRQVQQAFATGNETVIRSLVERFLVIMDFPDEFRRKINRTVISLPWAGDCATQILPLNDGESWDRLRKTLPAVAALVWHDSNGQTEDRMREIRTAMSGARWALGVAGGDEEEGSCGRMLIANIQTEKRKYRVASGWNVRRSLDAQQAENVVADDTVLPIPDYDGLNTEYQRAFKELRASSTFRCATLDALKNAQQNQIKAVSTTKPSVLPNITLGTIPASKPFGYV
jgi:hypothetical protein